MSKSTNSLLQASPFTPLKPCFTRPSLGFLFWIATLILGLWLRASYPQDWLLASTHPSHSTYSVYQVEADAYARLARVQRILEGHGLIQNFHPHENYPEGLVPTTTLPFDLIILALYWPLSWVLSNPLDWAGALASPFLYLVLALYLTYWSQKIELHSLPRALLFLGIAALPGFVWATPFARPDHQSLILVLLIMAWSAEELRGKGTLTEQNAWAFFSGITWSLALWTSFFEPLLFFTIILIANLSFQNRFTPALPPLSSPSPHYQKHLFPYFASQPQQIFLLSFLVGFLAFLFLEGFHLSPLPSYLWPELQGWFSTINELQPMTLSSIQIHWAMFFWLFPLFLLRLYQQGSMTFHNHLLVLLTFLTVGLSLWQQRWFYFGSMTLLFLAVLWLQRERYCWLQWLGASFLSFGLISSTWLNLQPHRSTLDPIGPQLEALGQVIKSLSATSSLKMTTPPQAILAPYWLGPALLYYSGQPIVASSSHMSLPGIIDSAHYFLSPSWKKADEILQQRQVRWIVAFIPEWVEFNAQQIRKQPTRPASLHSPRNLPLAYLLYHHQTVPTRYRLRAVQPDLKLYEYLP